MTPRRSTLVASAAVLGLVLLAGVIVLVLNSAELASPSIPVSGGNGAGGSPGQPGILGLQVLSNQNESNRLSNPVRALFDVGGLTIHVVQDVNSSRPLSSILVTGPDGHAVEELPPSKYVVNLRMEALDLNFTVPVTPGNETDLLVTVLGTAYPVTYTEVSTFGGASELFAQLRVPTTVGVPGERVILKMLGPGSGRGELFNATVLSSQSPAGGQAWLTLGAQGVVDPVNATSFEMTTWAYSQTVIVTAIPVAPGQPLGVAND